MVVVVVVEAAAVDSESLLFFITCLRSCGTPLSVFASGIRSGKSTSLKTLAIFVLQNMARNEEDMFEFLEIRL
uniref:Uncharacterized protein n=1 Tax=Octopus bimaculoides TaxID=37653 RepID=A0A0L8FZT6_OCTBM